MCTRQKRGGALLFGLTSMGIQWFERWDRHDWRRKKDSLVWKTLTRSCRIRFASSHRCDFAVCSARAARFRDEQSGVLGHGGKRCSSHELGETSHWGPHSVAGRRFHVISAWKMAKTARRLLVELGNDGGSIIVSCGGSIGHGRTFY